MLKISQVTSAIVKQLRETPGLVALVPDSERIVRAEYVNVDPANTPWIGVYREPVEINPRTLGRGGKNWQAKTSVLIVAQAFNDGGEKTEDTLSELVDAVLDALRRDLTFGGNVELITGFNIDWSFRRTDSDKMDFQQAIIMVEFDRRMPE